MHRAIAAIAASVALCACAPAAGRTAPPGCPAGCDLQITNATEYEIVVEVAQRLATPTREILGRGETRTVLVAAGTSPRVRVVGAHASTSGQNAVVRIRCDLPARIGDGLFRTTCTGGSVAPTPNRGRDTTHVQ